MIKFWRKNGTFAIIKINKDFSRAVNYVIQFSLVDMWKYPHTEPRNNNNGSWLWGWGFFYIGKLIVDYPPRNTTEGSSQPIGNQP